jgi:hypothetical protein
MTTSLHPAPETVLQKEQELFGELFARLRDAFLNRAFNLRPNRAARRRWYLIFLLFFISFLFTLTHENYSLSHWTQHIQDIFSYLSDPLFASNYVGNPLENLLRFVWRAFTDTNVSQYVTIFLAALFIALQSAALYLADVFELEDVRVARRFVRGVALSGSNETIRISQGDISEESRELPTYLIGGPGEVIVGVDSAALFERPDGAPRVIGPTAKEPGGRAKLEGFERFRQAVDLRDHYADLSVTSRSRDGIPVTATDVHMVFSVHRGGKKATGEFPYPFNEKAIQQLIYKALSRVTPDLLNPSTHEFSWIGNMIALIRSELGGFMNQHKLTEYLASIGMPEFERAKAQEAVIAAHARQLVVPVDEASKAQEVKLAPTFTPRREITNLFSQFAQKFSDTARDRGVELHWIGVGTWKTSSEIVPEKHLEAWKLSQENLYRESKEVLKRLEQEAIIQKMVNLIGDVPVAAYQKVTGDEREHNSAMRSLLLAYRQQLLEAAEFIQEKGERVSPGIVQAMKIIAEAIGITDWHWAIDASKYEGDFSRPTPIVEKTVALVRIKDLPTNKQLHVGESYLLEVDIVQDLSNSSLPIESSGEQLLTIGIVVQADDMIIQPDWFHEVVISSDGKSESPEFTLIPLEPGDKTITVQYYYKFHWLTQVTYHVEVIQKNSVDMAENQRNAESAFDELVQLVGGNQVTAERLIRFERIQSPDASRLELIEQAISRILRDRS